MITILQRVTKASIEIEGKQHSRIENGYVLFLGVNKVDTEKDVDILTEKILTLRIMADRNGKMNIPITDTKGEILVVSQFTLSANMKGGRRPDFVSAMEPKRANELYSYFVKRLSASNLPIKTGVFGAKMQVNLINDGPVTFILDSHHL